MLLLPDRLIESRRIAAAGPLAPLADALAAGLEPMVDVELYLPSEKALLSRTGGKCEVDGTLLDFDPYSPDSHRCSQCGREFKGEFHHRWWVYWFQLWLAERGVHAALLFLLRGDERHGRLARNIVQRYADAWPKYPNRDNVLGPTRLFFSTYLESIWLLQLCATAALLDAAGERATADIARERIIVPSAELIAQYDEGFSNRQVWNNAALMAAALVTGNTGRADEIVNRRSGLAAHLAHGLLRDGSWYEGENYHLFAHRGLWYGLTMAENAGIHLNGALRACFDEGFTTPFATSLPDQTLPSRKDSQYAISLRQPRFAEFCELGLARNQDERLIAALAGLYSPFPVVGRAPSTADVERNGSATGLTRADLGWRSLLHALPELPPLAAAALPTAISLDAQGISVMRRDGGKVYVALDWGQSGGGHGHPDRLNLLFSHGDARWLDDMGTGSYVESSLHWYRSTLAHNAPFANGKSQRRVDGMLCARDEQGDFGWVSATVNGLGGGLSASRAVIMGTEYFVDVVRWEFAGDAGEFGFELPIHFDGTPIGFPMATSDALAGGTGLEDGFDFVRTLGSGVLRAGETLQLQARRANHSARAAICADQDLQLFHVVGPGQPSREERSFFVFRASAKAGVLRTVWMWSDAVREVNFSTDETVVQLTEGSHRHRGDESTWQIEIERGKGETNNSVQLSGVRGRAKEHGRAVDATGALEALEALEALGANDAFNDSPPHSEGPYKLVVDEPVTVDLGEEQYRRSDESWDAVGRPTAAVTITITESALLVSVEVATTEPVFVPRDAVNAYDNESPDINGHGVQFYLDTLDGSAAWMIVPELGVYQPRVRAIAGWGHFALLESTWRKTASGFVIDLQVALPKESAAREGTIWLDVLVNESAPGRERRRGQLVMSGAEGEFVYLQGDRHDRRRLVPFVVDP